MDSSVNIFIIFGSVVAAVFAIAVVYLLFSKKGGSRAAELRGLMSSGQETPMGRGKLNADGEFDIDEIKRRTGSAQLKKQKEDINTKLFKAGFYSARDRRRFRQFQLITPFITTPVCSIGIQLMMHNPLLSTAGLLLGGFIGFALPVSWLERKVRTREEDTMYYLPLVIEQVSIGVSSSLDIGPCIAHIVTMANERDSHNPVTEMFMHVEKLIRSGLNLEDSLIEVGEANGMTEVKHAFMFLAQCAKHGGEISKQLQELADSVMVQRQVQVEGRITSLPVKATGPLATVFAGFFALLFAGLLVRLMTAFGGS